MAKFWEMLKESVIISGLLALIVIGVVAYLAVTGQPIPEIIAAITGTIVGYFFGAGKVRAAIRIQNADKPA